MEAWSRETHSSLPGSTSTSTSTSTQSATEIRTGIDYRQYLHSLFGESLAEYFLNPSSASSDTPPWYTELRESMGETMSAEALWATLRERSTSELRRLEPRVSQVGGVPADGAGQAQAHLQHQAQVRFMFRSARRNQAYSALLLQHNPLFHPSCSEEEGPSCYFTVRNPERSGRRGRGTGPSPQPPQDQDHSGEAWTTVQPDLPLPVNDH